MSFVPKTELRMSGASVLIPVKMSALCLNLGPFLEGDQGSKSIPFKNMGH